MTQTYPCTTPGRNSSRALQELKKAAEKRFPTADVLKDPVSKPCRTALFWRFEVIPSVEDPPTHERSLLTGVASLIRSKMIPALLRDSPTLSLAPNPQLRDVVFIVLLQETLEEIHGMTCPARGGSQKLPSLSHAVAFQKTIVFGTTSRQRR